MIRIAAADKDELFHKMAKKAAELPPVKQGGITDQTIFEALRKREEQFSAALGRGVIFPHARFSGLHSHAVIVVATISGTLKCETPDVLRGLRDQGNGPAAGNGCNQKEWV